MKIGGGGPGVLLPVAQRVVGSVRRVATTEPVFALTVDDGPDARSTPRVLDALARHRARATFFLLASKAEAHPALVRRIRDDGHEIALHGARHERLADASTSQAYDVVRRGRHRLERVSGTRVRWFRPPYGVQNFRAYVVARAAGMEVVAWTASAEDSVPRHEPVLENHVAGALARLRPGGILLVHDGTPPNADFDRGDLVDGLLAAVQRRGLQPMTVRELLRGRAVVRSRWFARAPDDVRVRATAPQADVPPVPPAVRSSAVHHGW